MPNGKTGLYEWYNLTDLTRIKENLRSDNTDRYIDGVTELINMALLTKRYARKLNKYERLYTDDGK